MAISPIGCRVIIQENKSNACCICTRSDTYKKCCCACKQEICPNCITLLMEQGQPCPYCRQNKGYIEIVQKPRVFAKNVIKPCESFHVESSIQNEETQQCNYEIDPLIKEKLIKCRNILIDICIVFGIGIVVRLLLGIMIPMFVHPKVFVIEFLLTITIGLLTIIIGGLLLFLLCCICFPAVMRIINQITNE